MQHLGRALLLHVFHRRGPAGAAHEQVQEHVEAHQQVHAHPRRLADALQLSVLFGVVDSS